MESHLPFFRSLDIIIISLELKDKYIKLRIHFYETNFSSDFNDAESAMPHVNLEQSKVPNKL